MFRQRNIDTQVLYLNNEIINYLLIIDAHAMSTLPRVLGSCSLNKSTANSGHRLLKLNERKFNSKWKKI